MKAILDLFDIIGAVVSSKMTGDLRAHARLILGSSMAITLVGYLLARS